jgi:hypothetical protein
MAGKLEVSFVEKVRFDAAARQVWRSIAGRTIEAIFSSCNPSMHNGWEELMFWSSNVVHDFRNDSLGKSRAYPNLSERLWLAGEKSFDKSEGNDIDPGIPRPQFKNLLNHLHSHLPWRPGG